MPNPLGSTSPDTSEQVERSFDEAGGAMAARPATLRLTLLLGFAGVLLLMGAVAIDSARQLRDVTLDSSLLRRDYIGRDRLLDKLRAGVYNASTVMRDGLLARDEATRSSLRAELEGLRKQNKEILSLYRSYALPSDQLALEVLGQRSGEYFDALTAALADPAGGDRKQQESAMLRGSVVPHRTGLIDLVAQADALNQRDVTSGDERIQTLQAHFQRRVESLSVVALALSAILAVLVVLRQERLEDEASARFAEIQQARRDLRLLSNRLLAAQEEERRNISRELHDQVGQSMSAMLMDFGRMESRLCNPEACREILVSARRTAEENLARVRDLSLLLRPSMLDELGLLPALQWQAREMTRRTGLSVKLIADDVERDLPDEHRTCVFRIVQEALHNCVKHAQATEARVVVTLDDDALLVSVQDNGGGFDPARQKGLGLLGIDERAKHLGGGFSLDSGPGSGTVLSVRLPLPVIKDGPMKRSAV